LDNTPAPELADEWLTPDEISEKESPIRTHLRNLCEHHRPDPATPGTPSSNHQCPDSSVHVPTNDTPKMGKLETDALDLGEPSPNDSPEMGNPHTPDSGESTLVDFSPSPRPVLTPFQMDNPLVVLVNPPQSPVLRRSSRIRTPTNWFLNPGNSSTMDFRQKHILFADTSSLSFPTDLTLQTIHQANWDADVYSDPCLQPFQHLLNVTVDPFTMETYTLHPLLFKSQIDALDNPRYRKVASLNHEDPESQCWKEAMNKELQQLHDKGTYNPNIIGLVD
jgi:hypothetical protein